MNEYTRSQVSPFRKVKEQWGEFSNMSPHPIVVNGNRVLTSEALYQMMKYPDRPDIQRRIFVQKSPMAAKMVQKGEVYRNDWDQIKIDVMEWCLRVKLSYHFVKIRKLFEESFDTQIVEESHKDQFWGAVPVRGNPNLLVGENVLGQLWDQLRNEFDGRSHLLVPVPPIENFLLFGEEIETIDRRHILREVV